MTTTIDKARKLIASNPQHAVAAAREFERLHRANPNDSGYRRIYWELQRQVDQQYPITRPERVDPPAEAWDDEDHEFWSTDPWTRFDMAYSRARTQLGWVNARIIVSELQQAGQDII